MQTVNARDLHEKLEVGKVFAAWITERVAAYGFVEGADFVTERVGPLSGSGNRGARIDYHLTLGMAKELAMVERNDAGRRVRLYFIECERRAKAKADPVALLNDPAHLRTLLLGYAERAQELEAKVVEMAPKARQGASVGSGAASIPDARPWSAPGGTVSGFRQGAPE